jgi:hypothetical protein
MRRTETDSRGTANDRRLGDEWLDWNGLSDPEELEIDEKLRTFFVLAGAAVLMMIAGLELGWYLAKPRIELLSPPVSRLVGWTALILLVVFVVIVGLEMMLLLKFRKSLMPYILAERVLLSLLSKTVWLGSKIGISKDRVSNSFIKVHNLMLRSHASELKTDTLLILLPRCLDREARREIIERANGKKIEVVTASGGEEARKAIREHKPSLILAIACERDLVSGIKDVAQRIPVLAIPNKRPEGPCKNTRVCLGDLDEAFNFIENARRKAG